MACMLCLIWSLSFSVLLGAHADSGSLDTTHLIQRALKGDGYQEHPNSHCNSWTSPTYVPGTVQECKNNCDASTSCEGFNYLADHGVCAVFPDLSEIVSVPTGNNWHCYVKDIPAPTPAPTAQASGDPHCNNMKGESFDIRTAGEVTMLRVPGPSKRPDFKVTARIDHINHHDFCGPTVIKEVRISGKWLAHGDDEIVVTPGTFGIPYVHGPWMDIFQNQSAPSGLSLNTMGRRTTTNTLLGYLKMTVFETVIMVLQRRGTMSGVNYFDMRINNIKALGKEIGGLLGTDPHDAEVVPPLECQNWTGKARLNTEGAEATSAVQGRMMSVARVE